MSELKAFNSERIYWAVEQVEREAGDIDTLHLDDNLFYIKSEVDAAIGELKDKIQQKDFFWNGCGFSKMGFKNTIDVATYVEELKADNESLRKAASNWHDKYCNLQESNVKIDTLASECRVLREMNVKAQEEIATLKDAQRWRTLPDEKPDDGQTVWAYEANTKRILHLEYRKDDESEGFICFPYASDFYTHITKWMPFEKPKVPEN